MIKEEAYRSSLFDCIKPSLISARTAAKWKSTKALLDATSFLPDELDLLLQQD